MAHAKTKHYTICRRGTTVSLHCSKSSISEIWKRLIISGSWESEVAAVLKLAGLIALHHEGPNPYRIHFEFIERDKIMAYLSETTEKTNEGQTAV